MRRDYKTQLFRATASTENQRRSTAIDMATALSNGAIRGIFTDAKPARPVVQLINAKAVLQADGSAPKKVKAEISDGEEFGVAVLTSTVAENLAAGKIGVNDAVCLKNYMVNQLGKTKICIVLDCERTAELGEKVGEPVSWEAAAAPPPAAPAATVAAAAAQSSTTPGKPGGASAATPVTSGASRHVPATAGAGAHGVPPMGGTPQVLGRPVPIEALNPYNSKWTIKATVISKGEVRRINTRAGEMPVFDFAIADDSAEIRVTCWRETAEKFAPMIEIGKVYLISRGQVKPANKKFSTLNNDYELTLGNESALQLCADEVTKIKRHYNFVSIADVGEKAAQAVVDVIGVVTSVGPAARILAKSGNELTKRVLVIADDSGASIELTIWGDNAEKFPDDSANAVIAFKGLRVTEWNQKSLGTSLSSTCARHAPATPTLGNSRGSPFPPQLRGRARARRDGAAAGVVRCWRQRGVAEPLGCRRDGRRGPRAHRAADLL